MSLATGARRGALQRLDVLLPVALVAITVLVLAPRLASVVLLGHDDPISMLDATCNQGRFAETMPSGQWVAGSEWLTYWQMQTSGCFGQISRDLAQYDLHPPLYFWALHGWMVLFGVSITSALMLNLVLVCAAAVIVYATCRRLDVTPWIGFVAALGWALSFATRETASTIRPYTLLALCAAALLWAVVSWVKTSSAASLIAVGAVTTAGMLTQYHFVIFAGFTVGFAAWCLARDDRGKEAGILAGVAAAGGVLAFAIFPHLQQQMQAAEDHAAMTLGDFPSGLWEAVKTLLQVFVPFDPEFFPGFLALVLYLATAAVAGFALFKLAGKWRQQPNRQWLRVAMLPIAAGAATWLVLVVLWVAGVSPAHAMGLRYVEFITPALFVAVAQAANWWPAANGVLKAAAVYIVGGAVLATIQYMATGDADQAWVDKVGDADAVVTNSIIRGDVGRLAWYVDPQAQVYADSSAGLLEQMPVPSAQTEDGFAFVWRWYGSDAAKRKQIVEQFKQNGFEDVYSWSNPTYAESTGLPGRPGIFVYKPPQVMAPAPPA